MLCCLWWLHSYSCKIWLRTSSVSWRQEIYLIPLIRAYLLSSEKVLFLMLLTPSGRNLSFPVCSETILYSLLSLSLSHMHVYRNTYALWYQAQYHFHVRNFISPPWKAIIMQIIITEKYVYKLNCPNYTIWMVLLEMLEKWNILFTLVFKKI
jgi:hypothetical protein